jgi:pyruvate dehydrogenase (quinone)
MGLPPFREGIEFPSPDFANLARACGGGGFAARKPDELQEASNEAFAFNGPAIVDAVVVADELPNLPHVDLDVIGHYATRTVQRATQWACDQPALRARAFDRLVGDRLSSAVLARRG